MKLTKQQQKALLIGLVVVISSYVVHGIITAAMQAAYYQQQQAALAARQRAKAKADAEAAAAKAAALKATPDAKAAPAKPPAPHVSYSGTWRGRTAIEGRGLCSLGIEMKETEPGKYSGFSSLACVNFAPLMDRKDRFSRAAAVLNRMNPADAVLSGVTDNGSIQFHVEKVIGASSNGCAVTSITLTPFGGDHLAAQWQEAGCQGGHVVLGKAKR